MGMGHWDILLGAVSSVNVIAGVRVVVRCVCVGAIALRLRVSCVLFGVLVFACVLW